MHVDDLPSASRLAARFLQEQEDREVLCQAALLARTHPPFKAASVGQARVRDELSVEVLAAFGEAMLPLPPGDMITRTASVSRKLKQVWDMFQQAPDAWEQFKKMLGVRGSGMLQVLRELPGKIKSWLKDGQRYLEKAGQKIRELPLVAMYLDVAQKMPGVTDLLGKVLDLLPESVRKVVEKIKSRARSFAELVDETVHKYPVVKPASVLISGAVFALIWFNVTEMTWDIPEIIRGFLGMYSWVELLNSLPESAVGLLLSMLFPGIPGGLLWNAILPATIAMRVLWLVQRDYMDYEPGRGLRVRWDKMPPEAPQQDLTLNF